MRFSIRELLVVVTWTALAAIQIHNQLHIRELEISRACIWSELNSRTSATARMTQRLSEELSKHDRENAALWQQAHGIINDHETRIRNTEAQ